MWPGIGQAGIGLFYPIFSVTYSGTILDFRQPIWGCSPLPLKIPGGSTIKFDTFSTRLLYKHVLNLASASAFSACSRFLSSVDRASLISLYFSKCCLIAEKSKSSKEVAPRDLSNRAKKLSVKFLRTMSFVANSVSSTYAHQLHISSTSGLRSIGLP